MREQDHRNQEAAPSHSWHSTPTGLGPGPGPGPGKGGVFFHETPGKGASHLSAPPWKQAATQRGRCAAATGARRARGIPARFAAGAVRRALMHSFKAERKKQQQYSPPPPGPAPAQHETAAEEVARQPQKHKAGGFGAAVRTRREGGGELPAGRARTGRGRTGSCTGPLGLPASPLPRPAGGGDSPAEKEGGDCRPPRSGGGREEATTTTATTCTCSSTNSFVEKMAAALTAVWATKAAAGAAALAGFARVAATPAAEWGEAGAHPAGRAWAFFFQPKNESVTGDK